MITCSDYAHLMQRMRGDKSSWILKTQFSSLVNERTKSQYKGVKHRHLSSRLYGRKICQEFERGTFSRIHQLYS